MPVQSTTTNSLEELVKRGEIDFLGEISDIQIFAGSTDLVKERLKKYLDGAPTAETQLKALNVYRELLREIKIAIGTFLKTDNVSFLFGAGSSLDAGGISMAYMDDRIIGTMDSLSEKMEDKKRAKEWIDFFYEITELLVNSEDDYEKDGKTGLVILIKYNIEVLLTKLYTWQTAIVEDKMSVRYDKKNIKKESLSDLIAGLKEALVKACILPTKDKEEALQTHRRMIKKVLTRPLNLKRVNIFTLNYDSLFEQAADAEGVVCIDGFVGSLRRIFRPESFDQDLYFPAQTTEGKVHRLERVIHLYKLHGSINWYRTKSDMSNPYGLHASFSNERQGTTNYEDVIIYPTPLKYEKTVGLPYSELFRRFQSLLVQRQSILFVIGYGFGDDHVNALILQALAVPTFKLVIIDPYPQSDFVKELEKQTDDRIWVLKGMGSLRADSKVEKTVSELWGLGTARGFTENLLPDIQGEEIQKKVINTYNSLAQTLSKKDSETGEANNDK